MKYKLKNPATIGDLANPVLIEELELFSMSMTFDPEEPVLSVVLIHRTSGWKHVVTYTDPTAVEFWAHLYEAEFDFLRRAVLQKLVADGKLPPGTLA